MSKFQIVIITLSLLGVICGTLTTLLCVGFYLDRCRREYFCVYFGCQNNYEGVCRLGRKHQKCEIFRKVHYVDEIFDKDK